MCVHSMIVQYSALQTQHSMVISLSTSTDNCLAANVYNLLCIIYIFMALLLNEQQLVNTLALAAMKGEIL